MGIARFYRWLSERYPLINENITAEQIPEFDNLYLDMNGIIHNCSHANVGGLCIKDESDVFVESFKYIVKMFQLIRPKKMLYMAVDGCAPRAKMNQQRSRRFRAANDAREDKEKKLEMGEVVTGTPFDSNCITPGTEFMESLTEHLKFFLQRQVQEDPLWRGITVVLSGPDVPGEGEHKIMDYIRSAKCQPGYDPNTRHCLYGLDADLIMLSLASHEPHFALLREEVTFGRQETKTVEQRMMTRPDRFQLLHVSLMREYLNLEFKVEEPLSQWPFEYNSERVIDDFILFCVLVGNDFLPHLPFADISEGGLSELFAAYKEHLRNTASPEPWLVKDCGEINFEQLQGFLKLYAVVEDDKLASEVENQKFMLGRRRLVGPADVPDPPGIGNSEVVESAPTPDLARVQYYESKFEMDVQTHEGTQQQRKLFHSFLEGMQWVLYYYFRGPDRSSWSWYYPYYHAPMVYDLVTYDLLAKPRIQFDIGAPFKPFQQLMAVYPAYSKRFLPKCYHWLFDDPKSPILNFYPQKFEIDIDGVKVPWGGVTLIPFIDPDGLLTAMAQAEAMGPELTAKEKHRNAVWEAHAFRYDANLPSRTVPSPMPSRIAALPRCFVQMIPFHHPVLPAGKHFVNDVLPGCDLRALGFPTLKRHPLKHSQGMGIKVFTFEARDKSIIVHLRPTDAMVPSEQSMRQLLDQPCLQVDYPFVHYGKVVAVHTAEGKLLPEGRSAANREHEHKNTVRELLNDWRRRGLVVQYNSGKAAPEENDAFIKEDQLYQPIVEVKFLESREMDNTGKIHYKCAPETHYRLLHLIKPDALPDHSDTASLPDRFPVGARVLCMDRKSACFGQIGTITNNSGVELSVEASFPVRFSLSEEAELETQLHLIVADQHQRLKWHAFEKAARLAQVDEHSAWQVLGTLFVRGADHVREDVGMSMMCDPKQSRPALCLPTYSIKQGDHWMFSDLAVEALKDYKSKCPELFAQLRVRRNMDRDLEARYIFTKSADIDYSAKQLVKYCNGCAFKALRLVPTVYMALTQDAISECLATVSTAMDGVAERSASIETVKGCSSLYRIDDSKSGLPGDILEAQAGQAEIGQRAIIVRPGGLVPCGARCTIVAVYSGKLEQTVEVVLDEDSFGANNLQGRAPPMRGLRIPAATVMSLCKGGMQKVVPKEVRPKADEVKVPKEVRPKADEATAPKPVETDEADTGAALFQSLFKASSSSTGRLQEKLKAQLEGNSSSDPIAAAQPANGSVGASASGTATGAAAGKGTSQKGKQQNGSKSVRTADDEIAKRPGTWKGDDEIGDASGTAQKGKQQGRNSKGGKASGSSGKGAANGKGKSGSSAKSNARDAQPVASETGQMWAGVFDDLLQLGNSSAAGKTR